MSIRFILAIGLVLSVGGLQTAGRTSSTRAAVIQVPGEGRNLALHKPYTVNRRPDYAGTSDSDHTQLTNGVYTRGYFWTQSTTVGWTRANLQPVIVTIDLGAVESIGGASYSTAAGVAGVHWPMNVFVLKSEDDSTWYLAGDLVVLDRETQAPPSPDVYCNAPILHEATSGL